MAIGDKVKIGLGTIEVSDVNVPVYNVLTDEKGNVIFDFNGAATPKVIGGVKGGSIGKIVGQPVKVVRQALVTSDKTTSLGMDYVSMYPVELEYYKKTGWFPQDHIKIQGEYNRS